MNLRQMALLTSDDRKHRAKYVVLTYLKAGVNKQGYPYAAARTYSKYAEDRHGRPVRVLDPHHYVTVIVFVPNKKGNKLNCVVSCSCDDNCFRFEWANTRKKASEIEYCNGQPPDATNPTYEPSLCKHLYALYQRIKPELPKGS